MSGLSFVHSGFLLAGAAAAALPILIHLMLRQRARVMPIGTVRFLQNVVRQHTRRRKIRQWILLTLRMLAILLLGLLFARPFWDRSALEGLNREAAVLIDRSASMKARSAGGESVFAAAIEAAKKEVAALDEETALHLAMFDAAGVQEIEIEQLDESLQLTDGATDYTLALAWARDIMALSGRPTRRVALITDLQQSGLRSGLKDFPPDVDLVIHDVGRTMTQNVSIESVEAISTEIRPKEPAQVTVGLRNAGALAIEDLIVELELDGPQGKLKTRKTVDLRGGSQKSATFELEQIETDGVYYGKATAHFEDDLDFDNVRWLALEARRPDRLLLVDGQEGRSVYGNETYYLEIALRLRTPAAAAPLRSFEIERIVWDDGEGFPRLDGFRAIVMANVRRLTQVDAQRLHNYVESGGNLLFFFGDQTTPAMMDRLRDVGLFSATIGREPLLGPWRVDQWKKKHPILRPFQDAQSGDLRTLRFERIINITNADSTAADTLLRADNQPILLEQQLGQGTALYFASSADRDWSRWPQTRLYVPLIRQMSAYLTGQLGDRRAIVEELVSGPRETAGVTLVSGRAIVRNMDPQESRLERVAEEDFRAALDLPGRDRQAVLADLASTIKAPAGAERANETWQMVIWILFVLLTLELLLACHIHA